ncbi:MAG: hypothetical protein LBG57_05920 [Treponema sp.]|jgi:hypothetical protein|nr:hypothetical protein [Treponema sp.]
MRPDRSTIITLLAAAGIVIAALLIVILYRGGVFAAPNAPQAKNGFAFTFPGSRPSEKRIALNLDLNDSAWPEELVELALPSYQKDFALYSAFSYAGERCNLTLVYATRAKLDEIRSHYQAILESPIAGGKNDEGVLNLKGLIRDRAVEITNYFSELANLIQVNIEMTGEYAGLIRRKIIGAFPEEALAAPGIGGFASGESGEGYVMYDFNPYAADVYAGAPLFSRAYSFSGPVEELKGKINALGERYTDPASAGISGGTAVIKYGGYLYQIKPLEDGGEVKAALLVQAIPQN